MTVQQIVMPPHLRQEAQRCREMLLDSPVIKEVLKAQAEAVRASDLYAQVDVGKMIPPSLLALTRAQSEGMRQMLESAGFAKAIASIKFTLPDGFANQIAAYQEQLAGEVLVDAEPSPESIDRRMEQLADEREAIIEALRRICRVVESFSYLPQSPIPPLVGFLIFLLVILSEVAGKILTEREEDRG